MAAAAQCGVPPSEFGGLLEWNELAHIVALAEKRRTDEQQAFAELIGQVGEQVVKGLDQIARLIARSPGL